MPCEACAESEFTTYLRWMRENVDAALGAQVSGQWKLNSALGLLTAVYCEALGKATDPAGGNSGRFHTFVRNRLLDALRPAPPVATMMAVLHPTPPFDADPHVGCYAFWKVYRNGFAHAFAPATNHPIEFRWGRYPQPEAWVHRQRDTCAGDVMCHKGPVDVIDLNVQHLGQTFLEASTAQETAWRGEITSGSQSWRELLLRLQT
jgi:hypothetical protein